MIGMSSITQTDPPHSLPYDALVQVEGEIAFTFEICAGNNIEELVDDVISRYEKYRGRMPRLAQARKKINGEWVDIIEDVKSGLIRKVG